MIRSLDGESWRDAIDEAGPVEHRTGLVQGGSVIAVVQDF
jgi:hypothetical protein